MIRSQFASKNWNYAYNNIQEELSELQRYLSAKNPQLKTLQLSENMKDAEKTFFEVSKCIDTIKSIDIPESSTKIEDMISKGLKGRFLSDAEYFQEQLHNELEAMGITVESPTDC